MKIIILIKSKVAIVVKITNIITITASRIIAAIIITIRHFYFAIINSSIINYLLTKAKTASVIIVNLFFYIYIIYHKPINHFFLHFLHYLDVRIHNLVCYFKIIVTITNLFQPLLLLHYHYHLQIAAVIIGF